MHMPSPCPVLLCSSPVPVPLWGISHNRPPQSITPDRRVSCPVMPCHTRPRHASQKDHQVTLSPFFPSLVFSCSLSVLPHQLSYAKPAKNKRQLWIDTIRPAGRCPIHPSNQKTGRRIFVHIQGFNVECVCHRKHNLKKRRNVKPLCLGKGNGRLLLGWFVIR